MEVLRIIEDEKMDVNAEKLGNYLIKELERIQKKSPVVGDVRGKGLMIGMQIVKDKESKEPDGPFCNELMERLREKQILLGRGGAGANVLRLQPPMCMTMDDAKYFIQSFEEVLEVK